VSASKAVAGLVVFTAICVAAAFLVPPIAQPPAYHDFADARDLMGVPRFADVVSNAAFLVAGVAGIVIVFTRRAAFESPAERWPFVVLFAGLVLTSLGSAYYHLAPDNARLVWDRLPITTTLAGLLMSQVGDRIDVRAANALLVPAVAIAAYTVWYWQATDNVAPYLITQVFAAIATFAIALMLPSRYTWGAAIYWAFACFVLSKAFEALDQPIYRLLGVVSGHTLKHLAAAAAGFVICVMLARRTIRTGRAAP
jgi:hypothetical protein